MPDRSLAVFPAYRDNPYLNLMLLAPRARGWNVLESLRLEQLEQHLGTLGDGDVFHMHWTAPIVQRADTLAEATERLERFRHAVDDARSRGAGLVWTIHNVLPHDARHVALELELNQWLAESADVIHVLNAATASVTEQHYLLDPAKVVHIPHPSYQGVYPASSSRADARASFGLEDDRHAVLFFGQIRPYKGLDVLIEAVSRVPAHARPVLLLAGRTSDEDRAALDDLIGDDVRTIRSYDYVPDSDVQRWFRAADLAVFPYRQVLNSGSVHLAASLGVPAVIPDEPHLRAEFDGEDWLRWFDTREPVSSLAAIVEADAESPASGAAAEAFSRRLAPFALSRRYADLLDSIRTAAGAGAA
ncbi:glycosyltransferase [Curtobacterium sp. ZW137]|uniref:glycosyltransferase n=1 Tax=Curtobacterium sp. ZW137 TaxID=2485104 RepID=UPI000F4B1DEE|nr:glycosyltransferase [Curtobacterium sp. ZW137]ROP65776.1 glycosyltransferase involved in cell wall biosynthesis [Curtobacterium sp. ZW137]